MSYTGNELCKYIRERMPDFLIINVVELLPHLHCLTQMDQEKIKAQAKYEGNEFAVPTLLDSVRRRHNWERQLINALRSNAYSQLADDLEHKLESLAPRRPAANAGASAFSHPNSAAAASSMVDVVPPPRSPLAVSLPNNPSGTVTAADNSESSPRVFPPPGYLPPQPSSHVTGLQSPAGTPVAQSPAGTPVAQSPAGTPVAQSPAGTPVAQSPAGTPVAQSSAGTPVAQSSAGTPVAQSPAGTPVAQSPAGTPVAQSPAGTPVAQSSAGIPVAQYTANQQPSALLVATSNTSSASSIASDSSPPRNSTELKIPIQEMGNLVDREESKDYNLPIQEKIDTSGHSKPSDSPQPPTNRTMNSDQNNSGEKVKVNEIFSPSTEQAKGKTKTDQAIADVPSTSRQVHPHRPPSQPNDDDYQGIDKPEVLRSDVENMQSVTEAAVNPSEGGCSITSRDLQLSESTVNTSRSNSSDSSSPLTNRYPTHTTQQASPLSLGDSSSSGASGSGEFGDKNSIKEQKIQALRGYQNDQLQRSFYDVHNPLNIQLNFEAQKNIGEGVGPDQDILNQNLTIEHKSKATVVQISNTEVAQSVPAITSTHPEFLKNVQVNNSIDTTSSSDLMLSFSDSECSFADSSANNDSVNEPRFHAEQGSQNANLLNNTPQLLPFQIRGVQVPAQIDDNDAVRENAQNQNQTTAHECKPEPIGDRSIYLDCNQSREDSFTETELDEESSLKVDSSERGGSSHSHESEVSHSKYGVNSEVENISVCNEDVKVYSLHIDQEPDYENEAANDREFEAANLGDFSGPDSGEGCINASSTEHVSLASQKRSEAKQPINPNGDLPQSNYVFVSMTVLVLAVVAGCVWKYYHK